MLSSSSRLITRRQLGALSAALPLLALRNGVATAQTPAKLTVQAATSAPGIGSTDFYVAQRVGFFKEENIAPELRYATNASQAAQLVGSGGANIGRFAFDPVLMGHDKGLRLRSFYQFYRSLIYYLAVPESSSIKRIEDVKGKTIAVVNMGSAAVGIFRSMLRQAGMPIDSATLVPVGKADAGIAALRAGRIDGFMFWNEVYSSMLASGEKLRFIKHPKLEHVGSNGYFATDAFLAANAASIGGFSRAIAKACVFIRGNYEAAAKIYLTVNPESGGSADDPVAVKRVTEQMQFWSESWAIDDATEKYGDNNRANLILYADELKADGTLEIIPPIDDVFTNAFVAKANDFDKEKVRAQARAWT